MNIQVHEKYICEYVVEDNTWVVDALESIRKGDWNPDSRERAGLDDNWKVLVTYGDGGQEWWIYGWDRGKGEFKWTRLG